MYIKGGEYSACLFKMLSILKVFLSTIEQTWSDDAIKQYFGYRMAYLLGNTQHAIL